MYSKTGFLGNQKGQALLIIVLVMVIALTVGLSLATRTIVNLRNTGEQAASQKALSAAEAGIEEAIKRNIAPGNSIGSYFQGDVGVTSQYTTTVTQNGGSGRFLLNGEEGVTVQKNDAIYVWVKPYTDAFSTTWTGTLSVYWGENSGSCNNAALEVAIIYGSKDSPQLRRLAYDECGSRRAANRFGAASYLSNTISNKRLYNFVSIAGLSNVLLIRINPIYKDAIIGVSGVPDLAPQGKNITSLGKADQNSRRVTVFEGYPEVPAEFFPYILFQP